jgi:integrase
MLDLLHTCLLSSTAFSARRLDTDWTLDTKMARHTREFRLETRTQRLKLPVAKKPFWLAIGMGAGLGYRRNLTAGTWVARVADGKGGYWTKSLGAADDFAEADGRNVMDFWQAQDAARALAGRKEQRAEDSGKPATVARALDRYAADLQVRGGDAANVSRIRIHLPPKLAAKTVALLTVSELRTWRDSLAEKLSAAGINRTTCGLKAALNLAADQDERIVKRHAWQKGLANIPGTFKSASVIVPEQDIRKLIACAYRFGDAFGLLVETAAVTGGRPSQLARVEVGGLLDGRRDPRLLIPSSHKGRARSKSSPPVQVPIPMGLAARLRRAAGDRPNDAPLLLNKKSRAWVKWDFQYVFSKAAKSAGLDGVTIYALRHSAIVRDLLASVPIRVVAAQHDTSVEMIEQTYSKYITDHSDQIVRRAMLDVDAGKIARLPVGEHAR